MPGCGTIHCMQDSSSQRVRCPCCGETFELTDDRLVADPPAATTQPATTQSTATTQPVTILLVFDGGSRGNPGPGYGSYQLTVRGKPEQPKRLEFGDGYTSNEAEYDTLVAALEAVIRRARQPERVHLNIRGDSQLVINQIKGQWKVREPRLQARVRRVHELLAQLGSWEADWHSRSNSVKAFGH
jgi:ribonuclease HI